MNDDQKKIARLQAERDQKLAQIRRLQGKHRANANKAESRKRFLAGEVVLDEAAKSPKVNEWLLKLLANKLQDNKARALFNLPPLPSGDGKAPSTTPSKNDGSSAGQTSTT